MLRLKNLGSGSSGNATVIEGGDGLHTRRLLVDCGLGIRQLEARLAQAELTLTDIDALFITHEHTDHIGCALSVASKHRIPVWMSHGTHTALGAPDLQGLLHIAHDLLPIDLGAWQATPFTVPHDAREPLQLSCTDGDARLGVLTDLGHITPHVRDQVTGCHALFLESNHDTAMLEASHYPVFLKRRVGGKYGHLANTAAADLLSTVRHAGLTQVIAAHLSAHNNTPETARHALSAAMGWLPEQIEVAHPINGTPWIRVRAG